MIPTNVLRILETFDLDFPNLKCSFSLHDNEGEVTLNITWGKPEKQRCHSKSSTKQVTGTFKERRNLKKPKHSKSPSQKRHDRQRAEKWRNTHLKKCMESASVSSDSCTVNTCKQESSANVIPQKSKSSVMTQTVESAVKVNPSVQTQCNAVDLVKVKAPASASSKCDTQPHCRELPHQRSPPEGKFQERLRQRTLIAATPQCKSEEICSIDSKDLYSFLTGKSSKCKISVSDGHTTRTVYQSNI